MFKNFLLWIILALAFGGLFFAFKDDAAIRYGAEIEKIPSVRMFGASDAIQENVMKFGAIVGVVLGLGAFILASLIFVILKVIKIPGAVASGISNLLAYGGVFGLGYELVYLEEKNSALASAIVNFFGRPLLYSGAIVMIVALIFLLASFMKKEKTGEMAQRTAMLLILISPLFLSGCSLVGDLTQAGCNFTQGKNAAHCYQEAAVQKNDEKICDKAPQGEEFKRLGSNPPKDKCYYAVAENKRDPNICKNIKGGMLSYSAEECATNVLEGAEKDIQDKLKNSSEGKAFSQEELQKIQKQMDDYAKMSEMMNSLTKAMHESNMSVVQNFRN